MYSLNTEQAESLYTRINEAHAQSNLAPHEKIPKFRAILEHIYKDLTINENLVFPDLLSRMHYVQEQVALPKTLEREMHALRMFANKVVHEAYYAFTPAEYYACLNTLCQTILFFSQVDIPNELTDALENNSFITLVHKKNELKKDIEFIEVVVEKWDAPQTQHNKTVSKVYAYSPEYGNIEITLQNRSNTKAIGASAATFVNLLWKHATLHFYHLQQDPEKPNVFATTPQTLIVLLPDYLIQATDIANCFIEFGSANPVLDCLRKFVSGAPNKLLLIGSLINSLFDELIRNPAVDIAAFLKDAIKDQVLDLITIIEQSYSTADKAEYPEYFNQYIAGIFSEITLHAETIVSYIKELQDKIVLIEPTFNSNKYGLQGRLDLLLIDPKNERCKDIIELKSGKAPDHRFQYGVRAEHEAQTHCYSMLLESTFPDRIGTTAIFYSQATHKGNPWRPVTCTVADRQNILMLRNYLVAQDYMFATNNFLPLNKLFKLGQGEYPPFKEKDITQFRMIFENHQERKTEIAYFKAYTAFLAREQFGAKVGSQVTGATADCYAALWRLSKEEKEDNYVILTHLTVNLLESDLEKAHLKLQRLHKDSKKISNFRNSDIVILYPVEENGTLTPLEYQIIKGTIKNINENEIIVSLRNKQSNLEFFTKHTHWVIEHDFLEKSFTTLYQSLFNFIKSHHTHKKKIILGETKPSFNDNITINLEHLEPEQNDLLSKALNAQDYFLLQGPPGTGKTSIMLKSMVEYLFHNTKENILVLAYTNRAVDEICSKLTEIPFFRLGFSTNNDHVTIAKLSQAEHFESIYTFIQNIRVVVSTVSSFHSAQQRLTFKHFHTAIIDEASQLLEPHLAGILVDVERFILIGDEKQLPAIVTQNQAQTLTQDTYLNAIGIKDLGISLFERLILTAKQKGWFECFGTLIKHSRMHAEIADFVNKHYYDDKLIPKEPLQNAPFILYNNNNDSNKGTSTSLEQILFTNRVLFFNSVTEQKTKVHHQEAKFVAKLIDIISKNIKLTVDTVGVITPFRAQIAEISKELNNEQKKYVSIDTVERFQGSERTIIILSLALSYAHLLPAIQSLTIDKLVDRKLNVALTRAKEQIIIVGCGSVLINDLNYYKLIEHIQNKQAFFEL